MKKLGEDKNIDILFLDGLEPINQNHSPTFLTYLFPLATVLEQNNFSFKVLNIATIGDYSLNGIINCLKKTHVKVIGMTTNVDNIRTIYRVVEKIKKHFPNIPIILGGSQVTFSDIKTMRECKCDVIVRHEGEEKLIDLLNYYINNTGNLEDIKGITFRKNDSVQQNRDAQLIDVNTLFTPQYAVVRDKKYWIIPDDTPFKDFSIFLQEVTRFNSIFLSARGCPFRCAFCVEGNLQNKLRIRSVEKVIQDIRYFLEVFNTPYIIFGDDTFTSIPKRVIEICRELKRLKKKKNFIWFAEGRVDMLSKNLHLISIMHDAGLYKLQIGVESGSQKILNNYRKGITLDQIEKVVDECSKYDNLIVHGNIILGNPGETIQIFEETLKFAKKLIDISKYKIDLSSGYLVPFVGTPIRNTPEEFGLEILFENFEFETIPFLNPICKPKDMSLDELYTLYNRFETEISNYYKQNIWSLPKKEIDNTMRLHKKFGGREVGIISKAWAKTFYKLLTFQRYYNLLNQKSTVNTLGNSPKFEKIKVLIPLRLWDIDYNQTINGYNFISFNNEQIVISGQDIFLWELASGKNTIEEIVNYPESPFPRKDESVHHAFIFYQQLEEKFALLFREF